MKRILSLLLISAPLFASQQPNKPNLTIQKMDRDQVRENLRNNRDNVNLATGMALAGSIIAAPVAPILVPVTFASALALRIFMDEGPKNK